jgi:S-adenosylmethionine uptake transporter
MLFFAALSAMPLGAATALFFVAPLFITLLAIPVLGEPVGRQRLAAVAVGLLGVAVMAAPGVDWGEVPRWALSLPVLAAACYAGMQVLTRKLGAGSAASAMAIYIQGAFILVSLGFWAVAGDGRYAEGLGPGPAEFLLRAWIWPERGDLWVFGVLGLLSALIGYALSQAYRLGTASVVASYEYVALPLAIFWGWLIFGEVPRMAVWIGTALIAAAGLWVFARERARNRALASARADPARMRMGRPGAVEWAPEWGSSMGGEKARIDMRTPLDDRAPAQYTRRHAGHPAPLSERL